MVNKKQIDALQSILETANEKFNNGLDLIHKDFERYAIIGSRRNISYH